MTTIVSVRRGNNVVIGGDGQVSLGNAQSAATALLENTDLSAREIVEKSLTIAGNICVFTNDFQTIEEL